MMVDAVSIDRRRRVRHDIARKYGVNVTAETWDVPADIAAVQRCNYRHMRASGLSTHEARHIIFSGLVAGSASVLS